LVGVPPYTHSHDIKTHDQHGVDDVAESHIARHGSRGAGMYMHTWKPLSSALPPCS
jgi:hypothetical protein